MCRILPRLIPTCPILKNTNVSLLCAIQVDGILASKAKVGRVKTVETADFINNELQQLGPHERKYIVMDNASIHKTSRSLEPIDLKNYILMFLLLYSPQVTPIEKDLSSSKARVRQGRDLQQLQYLLI
ncbi:hypothetical protein NGRA_3077 [Nosema granulosis]|uniref:Tc1-like transposase DDE domain-containing protein n=1 Tax=Nosema granulosis TaxID=83296 RepID=A0A9P6GYP7_9MICR|nr:hypothetical protein NGRA_3077 [Nosema granulosis]